MKIASRPPVGRAAATAAVSSARPAPAAAASASSAQTAAPVPTTSLMGIPADEVTPKVRIAIETLMREVDRLRHEVEEMRRRNSNLEKLADEDAMLPVVNRRAFVRELSRAMSVAQRYGEPSSVGYFDVNNMKQINDEHGHAAGDAALMHVADTLLANVRQSDIVGRLGGDEFGVILTHVDEETAARKTAELAEKISATPAAWPGGEVAVTIAYGSYTFSGAEDADDALHAADRAMYAQKTAAATNG